jgi:hypothetical protein
MTWLWAAIFQNPGSITRNLHQPVLVEIKNSIDLTSFINELFVNKVAVTSKLQQIVL